MCRNAFIFLINTLVVLLLTCSISHAETLSIASASNFQKALKVLAADFEKQTKITVRISSGSSGKLAAQISQGAPFDIFLSADQSKPDFLVENGHAIAESQFTYAIGQLVLWKPSATDTVNESLLSDNLKGSIAIANPKHAPYGRAGEQVLTKFSAKNIKRITAENVSQAYQFISSGNVAMGLIARSLLDDNTPENTFWLIPSSLHEPIKQDAVITRYGQNNPAAQQFIRFIKSEASINTLKTLGYLDPSVS